MISGWDKGGPAQSTRHSGNSCVYLNTRKLMVNMVLTWWPLTLVQFDRSLVRDWCCVNVVKVAWNVNQILTIPNSSPIWRSMILVRCTRLHLEKDFLSSLNSYQCRMFGFVDPLTSYILTAFQQTSPVTTFDYWTLYSIFSSRRWRRLTVTLAIIHPRIPPDVSRFRAGQGFLVK